MELNFLLLKLYHTKIMSKRNRKPFVPLEIAFKSYAAEELAWDYHCNVYPSTRKLIRNEALRQGIDFYAIEQGRKGDPLRTRPPCNHKCNF